MSEEKLKIGDLVRVKHFDEIDPKTIGEIIGVKEVPASKTYSIIYYLVKIKNNKGKTITHLFPEHNVKLNMSLSPETNKVFKDILMDI